MTDENLTQGSGSRGEADSRLAARLSAVGGGLFFIWIGVVYLQDYGSAVGLLGVGIITLVMQVFRRIGGLAMEAFWVVIGVLFTLGGLWAIFEINAPLVPIVLILAGLVLILSILRRK